MKIFLSIIIVNYNTKDVTVRCLESIYKSKIHSLSFETIVIDNGSDDGSCQAIESLNLANLKVIVNEENQGFAKAVNQGLKEAQGDYFLLLNSDIVVKAESIEKVIDFALEKPGFGVISGQLLDPNGQIQGSCFNLPTLSRAIKAFCFRSDDNFLTKYTPEGDQPIQVEAVTGAVFLFSRLVFEKVGFFDERYFMYFEDLDYCRRLKKENLPVFYLTEAQFIHAHGASGKKMPGTTHRWLVQSSKVYHGRLNYWLITLIIWLGQKCRFGKK